MFSNTTPFTMNVAPTGANGGFGFGNDSSWFLWIIVILALFGGAWGNGYGGNSGALDNYVLNSDFATLSRQIDSGFSNTNGLITNSADQLQRQVTSVADGICSLGYDQLAQMNGINTNIANSTNTINAGLTALGSQMQSCCCDQKYANATQFADVNYRLATDTCAINTNIANATRDIIDNDNANYRSLDAKLTAMESNAKDEKIATLQAQLSDARLIANNNAQTAIFQSAIDNAVKQLTPLSPIAAYTVPAPFPYCNCGCNC